MDGDWARRIDEGQRAEDCPPRPQQAERVVERAWKFVAILDEIARSRDGSPMSHIVALIAKELRDCLNDDDTGDVPFPRRLYDDGHEPK